ncbi:MAG: Glycyl-tRNA synthetase [Parcubacteria group bacterium GW2011_GWA2_31_28]|nr:MAG: Glycyl-tRNA synthetase [Parcubacteria group bacterium GW2011_GWA2_31_28]
MNLMDKIISLTKRRGFIFPNSEIYGGLANSFDYGPLGVELKNNIKKLWWDMFVTERDDIYGIDSAIIYNAKVWEASGHLKNFTDMLSDCKKCKARFRPDKLDNPKICPNCKGELSKPRQFNTMLKTFLGPVEDSANTNYIRPETAQGMFVNFKNIIDSFYPDVPFGMAQIGKAFRNEITPGNFIFRTREFEQMEIEYFIQEKDWEKSFEYWLEQMKKWMKKIGISEKNLVFKKIKDNDRAHYSKRTIDINYKFPFKTDELYGLAYRTDYDLKNHSKASGVNLEYRDKNTGESFLPHVIEPTFGVDRTMLAILLESYYEEKIGEETRIVLKLPNELAPIKIAILPLIKKNALLIKLAKKIYNNLKTKTNAEYDDNGTIGKRYRRHDEIGTPKCVTVDFDSLKDNTVTERYRDSMKQKRIPIKDIEKIII